MSHYIRVVIITIVAVLYGAVARAQSDEADRFHEAATVFQEIMDAPDHAIPKGVLNRAEAIAVFPSTVKGGFIF